MVFSIKVKNPPQSAEVAAGLEVRGKIRKWGLGVFGIKVALKLNMEGS